MGAIISSLIRTVRDQGGRPLTEAWLLWEFRDQYSPGGEVMDFTTLFRQVEWAQAAKASGLNDGFIPVVAEDYPGNAGSGRMKLFYSASGQITMLSGQAFTVSGYVGPLSGFQWAGQQVAEVFSGTIVSGARARIYAVGY